MVAFQGLSPKQSQAPVVTRLIVAVVINQQSRLVHEEMWLARAISIGY
jgi:hypothetical protein